MDIHVQLANANVLFDRRELKKAAELYKQIIEHDPDHVEALINLGCVYLEMDDLDEAISNFKKVLDKPSGQMEAHLNLAMAYFRKEDFESSEFHSKIVVNIDKYNQTALFIVTLSCLNQKKLTEARKFAETLLLLDDGNPENLLILAEIYELSGELLKVVEHLSKAIALDPNLNEFYEKIALIHIEHGEIGLAVKAYERRLNMAPIAEVVIPLYFCYLLVADFDAALRLVEHPVLSHNIHHDYLMLLALFLKKGPDEVKPLLEKIDGDWLPSLTHYYSAHNRDNFKRITSIIEDFQRVINPPNVIHLAKQDKDTYIRRIEEKGDHDRHILIWGCSGNSKTLKSLADLAGFKTVGLVVEKPEVSEFNGSPVYGIQKIINDHSFHQTPIIISSDGPITGAGSFKNTLNLLCDEQKLPNRVLHASCLLDYIKFPAHTNYVLTGYPGSGNLVQYRMLNEMLSGLGSGRSDAGMNLCSQLAADYYHSLMDYLNNSFKFGIDNIESAVILRNAFYSGWEGRQNEGFQDTYFRLYGLPSRFYAMTNLHMTHEPLTAETLDFFRKRSLEIIVFLRHPLDIIISCASKLSRQEPETVLSSPAWFASMIDILSRYFANYLEAKESITVFRYEDLLEEPIAHILRLAKAVNRNLSDQTASDLWERFGFKSLDPNSPQHLWRPGTNKWAQYLTPWHMDLLKKSELIGLASEFGYDFGLELSSDKTYTISDDLLHRVLLADFTFHAGMGKKLVTPMSENLVWKDRDLGVMAVSNSEDLLEKVRAVLQTSPFRFIHRSAFYPEKVQTLHE